MAGIRVRGDFSKLHGLIATLKDVAGFGPLSKLSAALAEESLYQVRQEFRRAEDPYGDEWSPLKHRKGRILRDTGRLANSFARVRVNRNGFGIASNVEYASIHQGGAEYTSKGGTLFRGKRGRIVSSTKAKARAGKRKRGAVKVGVHGSYDVSIPQRMMLPTEALGLGRWEPAYQRTAKRVVGRILRGKR